MTMKRFRITLYRAVACASLCSAAPSLSLAADYLLSKGQAVYVPVYSNIFTAPKEVPIHLSNILAIRNTDIHNAIQVTGVDYFDTKGTLVKKYYQKAVTLAPLETTYVYLSDQDQAGGFGANFIVRWQAGKDVNSPIIECLNVGQGRVFASPGQVITEKTK